jgi:hypothetical protein
MTQSNPECTSCVADAQNMLEECLTVCDEPDLNGPGANKARGLVHTSRYGWV